MTAMISFIAIGPITCSVCAPADLSTEDVERLTNEKHPTGISSKWSISEAKTFATGEPNPCPCEKGSTRKHWLLSC